MVRLTYCFLYWQIQIIWFLSLPFSFCQMNWQELDREEDNLGRGLEKVIPGTDKATWKRGSLVFVQAVSMPAAKFCRDVSGEGCLSGGTFGLNFCTLITSGRETLFSICLLECKIWRQGLPSFFCLLQQTCSQWPAQVICLQRDWVWNSVTAEKQYLPCAQFLIV